MQYIQYIQYIKCSDAPVQIELTLFVPQLEKFCIESASSALLMQLADEVLALTPTIMSCEGGGETADSSK